MSKTRLTTAEREALSKAGSKGGKGGSRADKVKAGKKGYKAMLKRLTEKTNGE